MRQAKNHSGDLFNERRQRCLRIVGMSGGHELYPCCVAALNFSLSHSEVNIFFTQKNGLTSFELNTGRAEKLLGMAPAGSIFILHKGKSG